MGFDLRCRSTIRKVLGTRPCRRGVDALRLECGELPNLGRERSKQRAVVKASIGYVVLTEGITNNRSVGVDPLRPVFFTVVFLGIEAVLCVLK